MRWMSLILITLGCMACGTLSAQSKSDGLRSLTAGKTKGVGKTNDIGSGTKKTMSDAQANAVERTNRTQSASMFAGTYGSHSKRRRDMKSSYVALQDSLALYAHVERRNGWIVGWGKPLAVKEAQSLPCYFRLSHPNEHGHWQKVEMLGRETSGASAALAPYWDCPWPGLTPKAEEWMRQSRTATEWHQTAGPDGDELLEERACNVHHDLLFATLYTPLDNNGVNLAFTDCQGLPIDVNPQGREMAFDQVNGTSADTTYDNTYGTTVLILRDVAGRDSLVSLCDGNGYLKSRADGVTALKFVRDSLGRAVYELSLNICDAPVLRRSGFCGWHCLYDGDLPVPVRREKVNTDLAPMDLPEE